jgi:hypothetical protein
MSNEPTKKELKLAERVNELDDAALQPALGDGGLFASAVKFLMSRVSRGMMAAALSIFIAFHAWEAFNESQQLVAELQNKDAEANKTGIEARSLNEKLQGMTMEQATRLAEMREIQGKADTAQAEADAATHSVAGVSARLAQLRAELQQKQADAKNAKLDADAATDKLDGVDVALVQKRADVSAAESEAKKKIAKVRLFTYPKAMDEILDQTRRGGR